MQVKKDVAIWVPLVNQPGALHGVAQTLAEAGRNILGLYGGPGGGNDAFVVMLTDDWESANGELEDRGYDPDPRDVLIVSGTDAPGFLAEVARRLAEARVNIEFAFGSAKGLVVGVDNEELAKEVLSA